MKLETIGSRLDRCNGVGQGFDTLRVVLAFSILTYHAYDVTRGPDASTGYGWLPVTSLLPMFFALSGFLITASGQRLTLPRFLFHRGLRIFPALIVEIVFSAFILGITVTRLPIGEYLGSVQTYRYLLNTTGNIQYVLPGVFIGHPHSGMVNASLWTIPWELACYGLISISIVTGIIFRKRAMSIAAVIAIGLPPLVYVALQFFSVLHPGNHAVTALLASSDYIDSAEYGRGFEGYRFAMLWLATILTGWEFRVVPFFLAGSAVYLLRYSIPYSPRSAAAILVALAAASVLVPEGWNTPLLSIVLCPALVYLTVFAGLSPLPTLPLLRTGDYSYGIYLYGYPIQQSVYGWGLDGGSWQANALIAGGLVSLFAAFSWHAIEHPILSRRRLLEKLVWKGDGSAPSRSA